MAFDGRYDLQQRRPPKQPTRPSSARRRRTNADGRMPFATAVRRRRREGPDRAAALVAALLLAVSLAFVVHRLVGSGGGSGSSEGDGADASPRNRWKLKSRRAVASGDADPRTPPAGGADAADAAGRRTDEREARHRDLYRPKFDAAALGYDIHDCPRTPPDGYPRAWPAAEVLGAWPSSDVTTLPPAFREVRQGLCVFDRATQLDAARSYRDREVPFVLRNDPAVAAASGRWEDPEYLRRALGDEREFRTERSPEELFMWYRLKGSRGGPEGYVKPPNDEIEMTFAEFLERALERDGRALGDGDAIARSEALRERRLGRRRKGIGGEGDVGRDDPLGDDDGGDGGEEEDSEEAKRENFYYFRINADLRNAEKDKSSPSKFIYDELTFFDPRKQKDSEFYMVDPKQERGINCRFGMRGVTAANHFDMSRNMIAVLGGERRYVLASPSQCTKMALYPRGHPSVRHSSIDWSKPDEWDEHPEFREALVNEVVLHAGDVLYLPTNWFHYIVNLSFNYQCNARSGISFETAHHIEDCGFDFKH